MSMFQPGAYSQMKAAPTGPSNKNVSGYVKSQVLTAGSFEATASDGNRFQFSAKSPGQAGHAKRAVKIATVKGNMMIKRANMVEEARQHLSPDVRSSLDGKHAAGSAR
jgi:hypothetical protein